MERATSILPVLLIGMMLFGCTQNQPSNAASTSAQIPPRTERQISDAVQNLSKVDGACGVFLTANGFMIKGTGASLTNENSKTRLAVGVFVKEGKVLPSSFYLQDALGGRQVDNNPSVTDASDGQVTLSYDAPENLSGMIMCLIVEEPNGTLCWELDSCLQGS